MGETVFLFDVDNTLLDNDRVTADLRRYLLNEVGDERCNRYWEIFEELRSECGYADYLGSLQRYRIEHPYDSHLLALSTYLVNYPFANRLFPNSLDVIDYCKQMGTVVIMTDGDVVFQPRKVECSGLFEAVSWEYIDSTSTRKRNSTTLSVGFRLITTYSSMTRCEFSQRSRVRGAPR